MINKFKSIGSNFIHQLGQNRNLIWSLTKRDFSNKYIKNYFGLAWAILDPLFFILILYLVFQYRFNTNDILGIPFVAYLITGYTSYLLFSTTIINVTSSLKSYNFLITKIDFHSGIIPLVKILSNYLLHQIILVIVLLILVFTGIEPSLYWLQIYYYQFALFMFLIGLGWFTSSISLFFPDINNIINIVTQLMFFMTPIFWTMDGLPKKYSTIMKLNPITYIVDGYRNSLLLNKSFLSEIPYALYFWGLVLFFWIIGAYTFSRLKPHFADVI